MRKLRIFFILIVVAVVGLYATPTHLTQAQTAKPIKYGDKVDHDITATFKFASYTFTAKQNDVVIFFLQIVPQDTSKIPSLVLTLTDSSKTTVDESYSSTLNDVILADGTYTLTVGRPTDNADQYTGKYNLSMIQPTPLVIGTPVSGTVTAGATLVTNAYYTVSSAKDVALQFTPDPNDPIYFYASVLKFTPGNASYASLASLAYDSMFLTSTVVLPGTDGLYLVKLETATTSSGQKTYAYKLSLTAADSNVATP
jgi:hypothetical protein